MLAGYGVRMPSSSPRPAGRLALGAVLALFAAGAFVVLLGLVASEGSQGVDRAVADDLHGWAATRPAIVGVLDVLVLVLGPWVFRAGVLVAAGPLWRRGERRLAAWAVTTMAAGGLLTSLVKLLVHRPRPTFAEPVATAGGYSFPSGHAVSSLLGCAVLLLLARPRLGRTGRALGWVLAVGVTLLTGFDRIGLGVHYVSDVVAGWLLALAVLGATTTAFGVTLAPSVRGLRGG